MGEHGIDLARFRGEISARHHLTAIVARDLFEQPLELVDVTVDCLLELAIGAIALADVVKGALTLQRVEATGKDVALAAVVAVPV